MIVWGEDWTCDQFSCRHLSKFTGKVRVVYFLIKTMVLRNLTAENLLTSYCNLRSKTQFEIILFHAFFACIWVLEVPEGKLFESMHHHERNTFAIENLLKWWFDLLNKCDRTFLAQNFINNGQKVALFIYNPIFITFQTLDRKTVLK